MRVEVTEDGPYRVTGGVPLSRQQIVADGEGQSVGWREGERFSAEQAGPEYWLCRCGHSSNKPFCDGTHERIGFDGTEAPTARIGYAEQAVEQDGPEVALTDAQRLCAFARFCDAYGQVWNLVEQPGGGRMTVREAQACPGGRLVAWDPERGEALEPELPPSIGVIGDPQQGVAGPLWVRGGIAVDGVDGRPYEVRNRVALCRCGASRNKPFCDGSHASIGFKDS
ncbi:iron-binding protein [Mangrovactinospora gilvigrisea]|uniref:Iron-binding protein n=2 Tax=Mangrovactinospora gilvigrisea TaxID=1428644 RepID=A0A1J7C313_9ACTN|nr:iron-binding protein [Mangrovactinospora gilvigrisea]